MSVLKYSPCALFLLLCACGDDHDGSTPSRTTLDAGLDGSFVGPGDSADADVASSSGDDGDDDELPKAACTLLTQSEVEGVAGFPTLPPTLEGGDQQCLFRGLPSQGTGTDYTDKGVLLEFTTNGRAIFDATRDEYASTGRADMLVDGLGDRAEFTSGGTDDSSMMVQKGDLLLRLNMSWVPGRSAADQLAGERQLLQLALGRL